ncbi:MAG: Methionine import ATP-binding protein MetN [Syntrophorhabdus sp. PtaB.Bin047]|jgi:D-methionine transport system ATP-binding protein|nr:MAG: Methionine import ATP-binding protein MetN [Syntrophorhabdus sp. PtaB.Bin047]
MITARNIVKSFGSTHVLRGLDLAIGKGSIYGLAGRSGAGKSTLLRCINGLEGYDSGSLIVDGTDVKTLGGRAMMAFRKNIGMIFQQFSLLERLSVYDNVALPLKCWKYSSRTIDTKVRELLEIVGIPEKIKQRPRELSGGQKQRVAIARALTMDPRILLCDEATSALDPNTSQAIMSLLKEINSSMGITIVVVTHQMSVIRGLCKEMAILENGRIAASGLVENIFREQPRALKNLMGEEFGGTSPTVEKTVTLLLPDTVTGYFISRMAEELGIDVTIRGSDPGAPGFGVTVPEDACRGVEGYLSTHKVRWRSLAGKKQRSPYGDGYKEQIHAVNADMV